MISTRLSPSHVFLAFIAALLPAQSVVNQDQTEAPAPSANEPGIAARGAQIAISQVLDQGAVIPTDSGFLLSGRSYRAEAGPNGLSFEPITFETHADGATSTPRLELSLAALSSAEGERVLIPSGPPVRPGGSFGKAVVTPFADAGVAQLLSARPDGVELEVWLATRPPEAGDLALEFDLKANLDRLEVETARGELELQRPGGVGRVSIGHATAIDATGVATELRMVLEADRLRIELPEDLIQNAVFPLLIDPVIGSQIAVSASAGTKDRSPDVVFDPITSEYVVVWQRPTSATNADIFGARVSSAGVVTAGPFAIDTTASVLAERPSVAVDPSTGSYLVAYEDEPSGSARSVRWSLRDSTDAAVAGGSVTVSGFTSATRPDVGYVDGAAGSAGFLVAYQRNLTTSPDAEVHLLWIDDATAAVIDASMVAPAATARDTVPAVPQLVDSNPSVVVFQRFLTVGLDLDVFAACVTLGSSTVSVGAELNVSNDATGADGSPDVGYPASGPFQVVWEHVVTAASDRNIQGVELLADCSAILGSTLDITNLTQLEFDPALVQGIYSGPCSGQALMTFATTAAPLGSAPTSILGRRWNSAAAALGGLEVIAPGAVGVVTYSAPQAALDSTSTASPSFLVVFDDDDGTGSISPPGDVFGQLYSFDELPVSASVSPLSATVCTGGGTTFTANVVGNGTFTYQWRKDGTPLSGETASSLTLSSAVVADAGAYDVVVTGTCGSTTSGAASYAVDEALTGVSISGSNFGCQGDTIVLTATATGGSGASSYLWLLDGAPIAGATASTYTIPSLQAGDVGAYTVGAFNACGAVGSAVHPLDFSALPAGASLVLSDATACVGDALTLTASQTSGSPPLSYEFFLDGLSLGAPSALNVLSIPTAALGDAGDYTVQVSNPCGSTLSPAASLTVDEPITAASVSSALAQACVGTSVTLTATTSGGTPASYGWFRDGGFVSVTGVNSLVLPSVSAGDAGDYTVTVVNNCGNFTSPLAFALDVVETPTSVSVSGPASLCLGAAASLNANVTGGAGTTISYQWYLDGTPIAGATSASYAIPSVTAGDGGVYTVDASNSCGTVTSVGASLDVDEPPTSVTISAPATQCVGSAAVLTANQSGGTGTISYQWYLDGTPIAGATSATYSIPSVTLGDAGSYTVDATNVCAGTTSAAAVLSVDELPSAVTISGPGSGCSGTALVLSVSLTGGAGDLPIQWLKDGSPIGGATSSTYSIASLAAGDAGNYTVGILNSCGATVSPAFAVTVDEPPSSVAASGPASACVGDPASFTSSVTGGSGSFTYQWFLDGSPIAGATADSYSIASVSTGDVGSYSVQATDACGSVTSSDVAFTADEAPTSVSVSGPSSVCSGDPVGLSSTVSGGTGTIIYQWFLDGSPIAGANGDSYLVPAASAGDAGSYTVTVGNVCGNVSSTGLAVAVGEAPASVSFSGPASACVGDAAVFTASATRGTGSLDYQWFLDGSPIAGATGASYSIPSVATGDAGTYTVQASNACGSVTSSGVGFTADEAPSSVSVAGPSAICEGTGASFSSSVTGGTGTLIYQWFLDGSPIAGANGSSYSIPAAVAGDAGSYTVTVGNVCGNVTSSGASLVVDEAPASIVASSPGSACVGTGANFTSSVTGGTGVLSYQWFLDGSPIAGATASSYSIPSVSTGDVGSYSVQVTNLCGSVTSAGVAFTADEAPTSVSASGPASVCLGDPATFTASAVRGTGTISYQWFLDGSPIAGATAISYAIPAAGLADVGSYSVEATNACGSVTSVATAFGVDEGPTSVSVAGPSAICEGTGASLSSSVTGGTGNLVYQWFLDGSPIAGANGSSYSIPAASAGDAGSYTVTVGNVCGNVTSGAVALAIDAAPTSVSAAGPASACTGTGATFTATATRGTGAISYQWFLDGSPIAGATGASYAIASVAAGDAGTYTVQASNSCGTVTSSGVAFTADEAPTGVVAVGPTSACDGDALLYTANVTGGSGTLIYQWLLDGSPIAGANGSSYSIPAASAGDAGSYTVTVGNVCANVTSVAVALTVDAAPTSVSAAGPASACTGTGATFTATATRGTGTISYQWFLDGTPIAGATGASYAIASVAAGDAGTYTVQASNSCGTVTSSGVAFTADEAPTGVVAVGPTSACDGDALLYTANVTGGSGTLIYQWLLDGSPIAGANGSSYSIPAASAGDAGSYTVTVGNVCANVTSVAVALTVDEAPTSVSAAGPASACTGTGATFTATATRGTGTISYQWFLDGSPIAGATGASYAIASVAAGDAGTYTVQASNSCGTVTSSGVAFTADEAPTGVVAVGPTSACDGDALLYTANVTGGSGTLIYQWLLDGSPIAGANGSSYAVPAASAGDAGSYTVTVGNVCANVTSVAVALTVDAAPTSVSAAGPASACTGTGATFTATATRGTGTISYQWFLDGSPIAGATGASYSIPSVAAGDAGTYTVQASNSCGSVTSGGVAFTADEAPTGVVANGPGSICEGSGATLTSSVTGGSGTLTYQWFLDGSPIAGANGSSYSIAVAAPGDAGSYTVSVGNGCGSVSSTGVDLAIGAAPTSVNAAGPASVCEGAGATFTATPVRGSGTIAFQWLLDGVPIVGATGASYSIPVVSAGDAGVYSVQASNTCGTVTSSGVSFSVDTPPGSVIASGPSGACDGDPVSFSSSVTGGTGSITYQWFLDGSPLAGATGASYSIPAAGVADAGVYTVQASNSCGDVTSGGVSFAIEVAPTGVSAAGTSSACAGDPASFSSSVSGGTGTIAYQWFLDGSPIAGATGASYSLPSVAGADAGTYTVQASNGCGAVTSNGVVLSIDTPATSVAISAPASGCIGTLLTLDAVAVGGTGTISYQWYLDGSPIAGATAASYTIPALSAGDAGSYTVDAINACGTVTSLGFALAVDQVAASVIVSGPASECSGNAVTLDAIVTGGSGSLSYQWFKDGSPLAGETGASLVFTALLLTDAGDYRVDVSNTCGSVSSLDFNLSIAESVTGAALAASSTAACQGDLIILTGSATGGGAGLTYEFFRDGLSLGAAASADSILLGPVSAVDDGSYTVRVANACGALDSSPVVITVSIDPPSDVSLVPSATVVCDGAPATFTATVGKGTGPYLFEFFLDGVSLGAPSSSDVLSIPAVAETDEGDYTVVASSGSCSASSGAVQFFVAAPPVVYCTSKQTTIPGCVPSMNFVGTPSFSAGSGFDVNVGPVPGQNTGLFIYTTNGPMSTPVNTAFGFLCIENGPGLFRIAVQNGGGNTGVCNGSYTVDFNAHAATQMPDAALIAGAQVDLQCWYRDGPGPDSNFSEAGEFILCP